MKRARSGDSDEGPEVKRFLNDSGGSPSCDLLEETPSVNHILEYLPTELWLQIFQLAAFYQLDLDDLLFFRTICHAFNKAILSVPKISAKKFTDVPKVRLFSSLRTLRLGQDSVLPDFTLLTSLVHLKIHSTAPVALCQFTQLTNLTKLTLDTPSLLTVTSLTSLQCLHLKDRGDYVAGEDALKHLPHLTMLISEAKQYDIFEIWEYTGRGIDRSMGRWEGFYQDGQRHGYAEYYSTSGDVFKGHYKDGRRNGPGVYYYSNGNRFEGNNLDGCPHGPAVLYFRDGTRYEGAVSPINGRRHGKGVVYSADGWRFEGTFDDGQKEGFGVLYFPGSEDSFETTYHKGVMQAGPGVYCRADGERFAASAQVTEKEGGVWNFVLKLS